VSGARGDGRTTGNSGTGDAGRFGLWRQVFALLRELWAAQPVASALALVFMVAGDARGWLYPLAMGGLIDALAGSGAGKVGSLPSARDLSPLPPAVFWVLAFMCASLLEQAYWTLEPVVSTYLFDHAGHRLQRRVLMRAAGAPLIQFEEGTFFDHLQRASANLGQRLATVYRQLMGVARLTLLMASIALALATVRPLLLPLLIVGSVPALWLQGRVATVLYELDRVHTMRDRVRRHLQRLLTGAEGAAEVRLFGAAPFLLDRWRRLRQERETDTLAAQRRRAISNAVGGAISALAYSAGLAVIAGSILGGRLSVGDYVAVAMGALWFQDMLGSLITSLRELQEQGLFLGNLFEFLQVARQEAPAGELAVGAATAEQRVGAVAASARLSTGPGDGHAGDGADRRGRRGLAVEARDLTFRYPGATEPALDGVSLRIARGERVAMVGQNGAGKTTLAKLLVGLYQPDDGAVTLDGTPLVGARAVHLRQRIAAVFQDYATFQLTLRENVGFGDLARMGDDDALVAAAERGGLGDLVGTLPKGCDTHLGRQFGDRDLSGGQWQRVALARAFFRDADLLILDEPTAALDPLAELALFTRFAELVQGRTAIMISHRLGAARLADRIVVVEHGRIVEEGPHDALITQDGRYAAMFAAQAQWYR